METAFLLPSRRSPSLGYPFEPRSRSVNRALHADFATRFPLVVMLIQTASDEHVSVADRPLLGNVDLESHFNSFRLRLLH